MSNAAPSTTTLSMQPVGAAVQTLWLGNAGVAGVNAGVDLGPGATLPVGSTSGVYGSFDSAVNGSGSYDYWEFRTRFTLSGGNDVVALSGYAQILSVPDADGLALALSGLLALGGWARRSRRG
jgi:hypothetical protein